MAATQRTPLQQFHDYLFTQVELVSSTGNNKRLHCKNCTHNFSGNAGRIHEHLICKAGSVRGCTFAETNNKREVLDSIDALVNALPKTNKRNDAVLALTEEPASTSGLRQMPIQQRMQAASKTSVDQAVADSVYETGISFNVFRCVATYGDDVS